jgi:hypothetical protein
MVLSSALAQTRSRRLNAASSSVWKPASACCGRRGERLTSSVQFDFRGQFGCACKRACA